MRPPVEKTRSLLAEDAGIARTMRAILASRGKASSWSFQKASTSTLRPGLGSVSYLRISCSRPVSLLTSPLSLLKMSLEVGEREGLGKSTSRASSPCWSKYFASICLFKSQSSRRERDFFLTISGFETRARFFLSTSQGSRRE